MMRPLRARLSAGALAHNLAVVRGHAGRARVMAIVKADAYGHGIAFAADALADADAFGVACLDEGLALREIGVAKPVLLLEGLFDARELPIAARNNLSIVVHQDAQIDFLARDLPSGAQRDVGVWIKIDTGMHRLGFAPERLDAVVGRLRGMPRVRIEGAMSHFARADENDSAPTHEQIALFARSTEGRSMARSLANSAGIVAFADSHFDWVRPGIMLYGSSPFAQRSADSLGLKPVMTLESELIAVHERRKGDAIGYGGDYVCPENMRVGVVAGGYGDGYPRHAPAGTPVLVEGMRVPRVGRVSMDMITVDLRPVPEARVGSPVVLWGEGLPVDEIAARAGTIAYQLFCNVNARVPRVTLA
jgi:alanine racemase